MGALALAAVVYTADRGYSWSRTPDGVDPDELDGLLNLATAGAEEALAAGAVRRGLVANERHAAAFSVRSLPHWDSEGRAALYAAFALFPCALAASVDLRELLAEPFFDTLTRTPADRLDYRGGPASQPPVDAAGRLLSRNRIDGGFDSRAAGALLAKYARRSSEWIFTLESDGRMSVSTAPWRGARSPSSDR